MVAPRTRLSVDERRHQLLELAVDAFSHRPYDEVSIEDIAQAAGISKGLLYHYFKGKRAFYLASLRHQAEQLLAATDLPQPDPPGPHPELLRQAVLSYLTFVSERGPGFTFLLRGTMAGDPDVQAIVEHVRRVFASRLLEGLGRTYEDSAPPLRATLNGFVAFAERASLDWLSEPEMSKDELADLLVSSAAVLMSVHSL
ncbi:MAG: TetR/AcrR family transcriptional regulator [Myxococcota bacterium]